MWRLRLAARQCLCCAICVDVCAPGALALRTARFVGPEGARPAEPSSAPGHGTFPFLARADRCDGCMECVRQCPTGSVAIVAGAVDVTSR